MSQNNKIRDGRQYNPRCSECNKYCGYMCDSGTHYGCSQYDPPEPHDPIFFCKKCANKLYEEALKNGIKDSDLYWEMPMWQQDAMKKLGLRKEYHKVIPIN